MNTDPVESSSNRIVLICLFYQQHSKKLNVSSAHAMKAYRESTGIAPLSLNHGAKYRWVVHRFTPGKEDG
jgi:hypothetical protein